MLKSLRLNKWFLILCKSSAALYEKNLFFIIIKGDWRWLWKPSWSNLRSYIVAIPQHESDYLPPGWNNCGPSIRSGRLLFPAPSCGQLQGTLGKARTTPADSPTYLSWMKEWHKPKDFKAFHKTTSTFEVSRVYVMHLYYLQVIKYTIGCFTTQTHSLIILCKESGYYWFETIHS